MHVQIPSYCPRCDRYFDAYHPRSEGPPSNWRHPFDFPPVLDDAPPIVRYCEKCRKEPGVSNYLKVGFLLEEYLSHCDDKEYAKLLRERITRETGAVIPAAVEQKLKVESGELSKKEKAKQEKAEKQKEYHADNAKEFWRDVEMLQREGKKKLKGEGGGLESGNGKNVESRPRSLLHRLRTRSRGDGGSGLGISTGAGPLGSVVGRDQSLISGYDGDGVSIDEYDSDETIRARRASLVSRDSRYSLGGDTLRGDLNG
ncbi:hypothetical protein MMC30_002276 [Trapelia coarctata]|nr:hypothetical protein [Trapelia coarctata]